MDRFVRDKDVSAMQLINAINKRKDICLSAAQEENQMQTYSWASFLHLKLSPRFLCPLSRLFIEMYFSSSDYGFTMNIKVTIRIKKLKPPIFSFTINFKYGTKKVFISINNR